MEEHQPARRLWRRPLVAGALAVAIGLSVGAVTVRSAHAETVRPPTYSGEAMITGLIYQTGPVAQRYPELVLGRRGLVDPEGTAAFLPRLYAETERRAPGFRNRFGEAMYSGNRMLIKTTTMDTAKVLGDSLVALIPELEPLLRKYNSDGSGQATWYYENKAVYADFYLAMEIGVVVALAAALTVALSLIDFTPSLPPPGSFEAAGLQLEIWSDNVARTLR